MATGKRLKKFLIQIQNVFSKIRIQARKINLTNNSNSLISKPDSLRVKAPQVERIGNTANLLNDLNLNTVCQEASCPNIGECFASGTATFLIMGPGCTRACPYCDIDFDRSKR